MKRFPLFVFAGVISLAAIPPFASTLLANLQPKGANPQWVAPEETYPLGRDCVVTVDSHSFENRIHPARANFDTGFDAQDTIRGTLLRIDNEWLVLRDGKTESWIPRGKVLLIHVCI